ncbi:MAG: 16S rRNA (adenine(1518)-N(6)/adenine(1519)-N(6))-dimethyltransferase RsmA [Magnetococcales bacterium]|nr:16S rRNA (adenine(1518)-N(6)/adenine(1519)-N(6))-dimethyltransferase RsmA [Magnetococcales bacterium]
MTDSILAQLRHHGIHPKKGLGQHFLIDAHLAQQIVLLSGVTATDRVVEIGPGVGALTTWLLQQAGSLHAIEPDQQLLPLLQQRCHGLGQLTVLHEDALLHDFTQLSARLGGPLVIVANLPYNISTPLLLHLLEQRHVIQAMTLMFQKEVADRLVAPAGCKSYGTLSVYCQLWCHATSLMDVAAHAFYPPPKVLSTVVQLTPRQQPLFPVHDEPWLRRVVRAAFGQRRKTLRNALMVLGLNSSQSEQWLGHAAIDPQRRGETLTLAEFVQLANSYPSSVSIIPSILSRT